MSGAPGIVMYDSQNRKIGGVILLDQGHRQLKCDWLEGCGHRAVIAIMSRDPSGPPQLACAGHFARMFGSIWKPVKPPRVRMIEAGEFLARNDQVRQAS